MHPETRRLCQSNEFGEIWVASDANGKALIGSKDRLDRDRFEATIEGDGSQIRYVCTGDLGFLHTVPHPSGEGEFQCLYYLGPIGETFEVNGLMHFYCDVEHTIERWCNDKWPVKLIEGSCWSVSPKYCLHDSTPFLYAKCEQSTFIMYFLVLFSKRKEKFFVLLKFGTLKAY